MQRKKGRTYTVWLDVAAHEGRAAIPGLRPALVYRFKEAVTNAAAADAILNLRQRDGESVAAFYDRTVTQLDRKNHSYTAVQKQGAQYLAHFEVELYTFFGAGLRDAIRARTLGAAVPPVNADALLLAARSVESDLARVKSSGFSVAEVINSPAAAPPLDAAPAQPDTVQSLSQAVAALTMEVQSFRRSATRNVTCYNCQGRGHLSPDCPSPRDSAPRRSGR